MDELRARLRQELPDHMIPAAIVTLVELPLNRNGKIDREALPDPSGAAFQSTRFEAPLPGTETTIAGIWRELLGLEQVGRNDSFFDLGGNSILLIRMLSELRQRRMTLSLTEAYRLRTLAACSAAVTVTARDPVLWLQSCRWTHKLCSVPHGERTAAVLLLDERGSAGRSDLQCLLSELEESKRPDFVRICADVEKLSRDLDARGVSALLTAGPLDESLVSASLTQQLDTFQRELTRGPAEVEFPFSPTQLSMMPWEMRDDFHCIAINGWFTSLELQGAFSRFLAEQDLLRSIPDMARARWSLLSAQTANTAALPVVDLRTSEPGEFKRSFKRIADQLLVAKRQSSLPYAAAWVSASDMQHYLMLINDHLIWDGASAGAFQRRLTRLLSGCIESVDRCYRDYVEEVRRAPGPAAWQRLQERFEHRELSTVMADTLTVLESKVHQSLHSVRFKVPIDGAMGPATQAFEGFKRWMMSYTGLSRFAIVLNHHARQLGDRSYFDVAGLFLDKLPFIVHERTQLEEFSSGAAHLHGIGLTYLGLEYAAGAERTAVLPPLGREILFNFQAYGHSQHELRELVVDAEHIREKLVQNQGVVFEASVEDGHLLAHCSFKGEQRDVESLLACMPGMSLIGHHLPEPLV